MGFLLDTPCCLQCWLDPAGSHRSPDHLANGLFMSKTVFEFAPEAWLAIPVTADQWMGARLSERSPHPAALIPKPRPVIAGRLWCHATSPAAQSAAAVFRLGFAARRGESHCWQITSGENRLLHIATLRPWSEKRITDVSRPITGV